MPVNPYDDRKVSLRRPHGNGDLDIVGASYTRRMANVTEALLGIIFLNTELKKPHFLYDEMVFMHCSLQMKQHIYSIDSFLAPVVTQFIVNV